MTQEEFRKRYDFNIKTDNIGGGSFGTVYKAYDNVLDREVAIKVSEVKNIGDKEFSLLEEYKAIENLSEHQNIANYEKVYRFDSFPATYDYGIMQYYSLGNLSHYLKNNEVSIQKRESITKGILEGIAFLHQHKVVHRDLKPSNILVVDRRGQIIPKITDFGLSKQAESDGKASRFTNSFAGGTLQYSSPEQLKGLPLKLNTDLWSFGAIAYEIITVKLFLKLIVKVQQVQNGRTAITQKILHADINSELGSLPIVWQKVVTACLERDVNKRIQNTKVLFSILNGDDTVVKEPVEEKQTLVKKPIKVVKKEVLKPNNDATIIKGKHKKEQPKKQQKEIVKPVVKNTLVKKENPKWLLPSLAVIVLLLLGGVYYMFLSKDDKPKEILTDKIAWTKAKSTNTKLAFYNYLNNYKNGEFRENALTEITLIYKKDHKNKVKLDSLSKILKSQLITVKGGRFDMGDKIGLGEEDEKPVHKVVLTTFKISKTEVTVGQYRIYCKVTGATMPIKPEWGWNESQPIVNISWNEAIGYCKWLGILLGKSINLPTEAQWEYAARGGNRSKGYKYSGSNTLKNVAWYKSKSGNRLHSVGNRRPNELGIYDMSGNAWEWCLDWHNKEYYTNSAEKNPENKIKSTNKALRGGSCFSYAIDCRIANRDMLDPDEKKPWFGFRVVSN